MDASVDLADYLNYLGVERGMSKNSVLAYGRDLKRFLAHLKKRGLEIADVRDETVHDHMADVQRSGISTRSAARALSAIKSFFRYLVSNQRVLADPVSEIQSPRQRKNIPGFLDLDEIMRLIDSIPANTPAGMRDRAMLELLYGAGIRVTELCDLNLSQLDIPNGFLTVIGKGNKERTVPIGRHARESAARYLKEARPAFLNGKPSDRVFLSRLGTPWTRQGIWKWLKGIARVSGLGKSVYPHLLRHTFATHVLSGGADLRSVQELLGHADISTTEVYTHMDMPRLRHIHRQFHPRS